MTTRRRRAMVLLLVLMTLACAAALITPLAAMGLVTDLESARAADALQIRLAVESTIALLPQFLEDDPRLARALERDNLGELSFQLGDVQVQAVVQDDSAKLPVRMLTEDADRPVADVLDPLAAQLGLNYPRSTTPLAGAYPSPSGGARGPIGGLDDLFEDPTDIALYGRPGSAPVWSQFLTPFDGPLNARRARAEVLGTALADVQPGIGRKIARRLQRSQDADLDEILASLEWAPGAREEVRRRLDTECQRYSLLIRISLDDIERQRYVICTSAPPLRVMRNWEVAP